MENMNIRIENLDRLDKYIEGFLEKNKKIYSENTVVQEKIEHIAKVSILARKLYPDNKLIEIAAKFHDIGRFKQFEAVGKFDDNLKSHTEIGNTFIDEEIKNGNLEDSYELQIIKKVVLLHGKIEYLKNEVELTSEEKNVINIVTRLDMLENGCIGAVSYLEREVYEDAKNYIKNNQSKNQFEVSPIVWEYYLKGQKFDKIKHCKTYADYILYAAVLAIENLKSENREIAIAVMNLECYGSKIENKRRQRYINALEGYHDIFSKLIEKEKSEEAYKILKGYFENKNFNYNNL